MNKRHIGKWIGLAALLLVLCAALSGCIVDPEGPDQPADTNGWKRYTATPEAATPTLAVVTPTPDPGQQSWDNPSANPGVSTVVPTVGVATIVPVNGTATPTLAPGTTATPTTSTVLKRGSQGDAVKNVQAALKRLGYFEGITDGDFGEYTENAVKEFQRQNGLTADGIVGPSTLAKLSSSSAATAKPSATPTKKATATPKPTSTPKTANVYLTAGDSGAKVTQMQNRLIELGYLVGKASGKVCDITEQAIVAFQRRNNLDDDGVAGPSTLDKLYSSSARKASGAVGVIGVTLKKGDEGDAVRLMQSKLKSYGYLTGSADGSFGAKTEEAVKAFQKANGLTSDGKAGAATLEKLFAGTVTTSAQAKATATPKPTKTPTPKPTATPKATPTPNAYVRVTTAPNGQYAKLERGMMGTPVTNLQKALKAAGYYDGDCDGYYGEETEKAVKRYQRDKGLVQDGIAGPATQRYLFEGDFPDRS
ncbi:MAG: peptidoglycan-binding protein [Clostridia bacterium]|nr:peptidoglycan-binding protein [Clostridia bacterium]